MEGSCSTGQSPQWAVMPVEEEEVYNYMPNFLFLLIINETLSITVAYYLLL
jgi:hypothetical protein